ncbi:major facilitator superfamily domain-containing protein [Rhodocollybia butyracea]|uniref:Major facilitator superfamily domain-containing protein n=1 Tax=Rhodocollybia butyracea TaxID=206335 RepID=A0A9P5P524_9AGAR|nr:major facilitator superfamily domain-containing protein [Rhodocollybia butyracea]
MPEPSYSYKKDGMAGLETILQTPATEIGEPFETFEVEDAPDNRATGKIASWRGGTILGTACFAQLVDNIWMTSINIAVPRIAQEFDLHDGSQSWLVSAYTLTFGGFLLLAGVLSDRFGRRLGAAASVPSAIGVLSNFFVGNEKHRALSIFGAAGAVGFVVGLILGGILSGTVGWRFIFYINAPLIGILAVSGWLSFPQENRRNTGRKPSLDLLGAGLGTSGIVLMTFALCQSEVSGWNKPIVVVTLIVSVLVLLGFAWAERKVPNPIMPLYLWKVEPSYTSISSLIPLASFFCRNLVCWLPCVLLVGFGGILPVAHRTRGFIPDTLNTGLYMIPTGLCGFVVSIATGRAVERFGAAFVKAGDLFWPYAFVPNDDYLCHRYLNTYNVASIALVSAVPPVAKSLAGGLINTAFQIGAGFGIAITSVVYENVLQKQPNPTDPSSLMKGYQAALFTSCGLVGGSVLLSLLVVRPGQQTVSSGMMVH